MQRSINSICSKKDSAKLAQEQSAHLYLCLFISDLTQRFGPVVRQAKVVGVLDAAFDVLVSEFGIEKRVHVDQMPIDVRIRRQNFSDSITDIIIRIMCTKSIRTH